MKTLLTLACFPQGSSTPDELVSLPVDWENDENMELVRSKLLSLVEVEKYSPAEKVKLATEVARLPDGFFEFDHQSMGQDLHPVRHCLIRLECQQTSYGVIDLRDPEFQAGRKE